MKCAAHGCGHPGRFEIISSCPCSPNSCPLDIQDFARTSHSPLVVPPTEGTVDLGRSKREWFIPFRLRWRERGGNFEGREECARMRLTTSVSTSLSFFPFHFISFFLQGKQRHIWILWSKSSRRLGVSALDIPKHRGQTRHTSHISAPFPAAILCTVSIGRTPLIARWTVCITSQFRVQCDWRARRG